MNCPICRENNFSTRYKLPGYRVGRCVKCGLMFNPDFGRGEKDGAAVFSESYYKEVQKEAFDHSLRTDVADASEGIYRKGLSVVESQMGKGLLLDVGCAFGAFMEIAKKRGWQVKGLEISPFSSQFAREKRNLDVITGALPEAEMEPGQFDLVTFWDVLEHVRDVSGNIKKAASLLKPGGFLIITTDNYKSLLSFLAGAAFRLSGGLVNYPVQKFFIPFNSCYFVPRDVREVLVNSGFEEIFFALIDYPFGKIKLNPVERLLLKALYAVGNVLRINSQFMIIARRKD